MNDKIIENKNITENTILYISEIDSYKKNLMIGCIPFTFISVVCFIASRLDTNQYSSIYFLAISIINTGLSINIFLGIFLIKPIVFQRNGIYFPFTTIYKIPLLTYPNKRFIDWSSIKDFKRQDGLIINLFNGKRIFIPNHHDDLDEIEKIIRNNVIRSSDGLVS